MYLPKHVLKTENTNSKNLRNKENILSSDKDT